jgi:hypothetical protein
MRFGLYDYDSDNKKPEWIEFTCSVDDKEYIRHKKQQTYFNIKFKKESYVVKIVEVALDPLRGIIKVRLKVLSYEEVMSHHSRDKFKKIASMCEEVLCK